MGLKKDRLKWLFETVFKLINRVVNDADFSSIHSDFNNAPRFSDTGFFWFSKDWVQGLGAQFFSKDKTWIKLLFRIRDQFFWF
jgi:hypothetical protein